MEDSNSSPDYDIPATDYEEQHTESTGSDEYEVPDSVIRDRQRDYTVISRVGNWEYAGKHELNSTYLFEKQEIAPSKPDGIEEPKNLHEICRDLIKSSQGILSIINLVVTFTMMVCSSLWKSKVEDYYSTDRMGRMWKENFSDTDINVEYCLSAAVLLFVIEITIVALVLLSSTILLCSLRTSNVMLMVIHLVEVILTLAAILLTADTQYIPGRMKELKLLYLTFSVVFICCKAIHILYTVAAIQDEAGLIPLICIKHSNPSFRHKDPESVKSTLSYDSSSKMVPDSIKKF